MTTTHDSQSCVATQTRRMTGMTAAAAACGRYRGVVGVQGPQPPGGGERQLARPLPGEPARPERQRVAQELAAQRRHDAVGGSQRREIAGATERGAGQDGQSDDDDGRRHRSERRVVQQRAVDGIGQRHRLHDHGRRAQHGEGDGDARDPPQPGHPGRQLRVDEAGPAPPGECVHRLNVVSFTETDRPMSPSVTASRAVPASSQVAAVRTPSGRSATMAVRTGSSPSAPP